jgi:hypothetical protein
MGKCGLVVAAVTLLGAALAAAGHASQTAPRLESSWSVALVFRAADGVADREVGQRVTETWAFRPRCARGACAVQLRRAGRTLLLRRSGATYSGKGSYRGALFCGGMTYPQGTAYVESWTVRITRTAQGPRGRRAVAIAGTGSTVGRSADDLPCDVVVSRERVELTGKPRRR